VLPFLIAGMRSHQRDPEFASRAAMVLKGLGPRRLRAVADHLDAVLEPLPLEVLVDVVASLEDRPSTYRLKGVIESLDARSASVNGYAGPDPYARVRGKAHLALARLGSRVAISDLKRTLSDPARRVDGDLLAALGRIGTRDELPDLLRAYRREDPWIRGRIREVFWQIVKREKIRRGGAPFQSLAHQDRAALRSILEDRGAQRGAAPTLPGLKARPGPIDRRSLPSQGSGSTSRSRPVVRARRPDNS
jgi:HEAT repeat protein